MLQDPGPFKYPTLRLRTRAMTRIVTHRLELQLMELRKAGGAKNCNCDFKRRGLLPGPCPTQVQAAWPHPMTPGVQRVVTAILGARNKIGSEPVPDVFREEF